MGCNTNMPAGVIATCGANFERVKNVIILKTGTKFANAGEVRSQAAWISAMNVDETVWAGKRVNSYETTTDDKNVVTFDSTKKKATTKPIPSAMFMLDTNFCDTQMLLNVLSNSNNEIALQLDDNAIHMARTIDGKFKGFLGTLDVTTKGFFEPTDQGNNAPMTFFGDSYEEFQNSALIPMDFDITSLAATYMPVGLTLGANGIYDTATGVINLQVNVRCDISGKDDVVIADFDFVDSNNLSTLTVTTLGVPVNGAYDVTIQKDIVPVNLAVGDFLKVRVKVLDSGTITYLSNTLYISVNE
jgi:hypothetical protein